MIRRILFLLIIVGLWLPPLASAQFGRWGDPGESGLEGLIKSGRFRPFIELNYGLAKPQFYGLDSSFNTLGIGEVKLGFAALDSVRAALTSLDERYVFFSYLGGNIRPDDHVSEGEIDSELTRFGGGNRLGYGFGGKGLSFQMYNQNGLNWTRTIPMDYDTLVPEAQAIFDRYEDSFRFGQAMEAGVKLHVARSIAISAGAEGSVIFPRHIFWPWLGSAMIYSGVQGGLQFFAEEIVNISPVIGPILHFVLKSGVSLGYYMLLREDMNWPFGYEAPLTVESLKLGVAITF